MCWWHYSHFQNITAVAMSLSQKLYLFTSCVTSPTAHELLPPVTRKESHVNFMVVLTLTHLTSPERGIEWLSLDTDLTVSQLKEVTSGWKLTRIVTEGHSEVSPNDSISGGNTCTENCQAAAFSTLLRGSNRGVTPHMLKWCFWEYLLC